ncbi:MAG TPA: carbonic anhydrase [Oculatellaceae cyanobacterium]
MKKLVTGIHHFQTKVFSSRKDLFERLAKGQQPEALFITCSDSRINPNELTQTDPGDLFILRNAGNIIPAFTGSTSGEIATIEMAAAVLKVKDIIVCGHSFCGAMDALLHPEKCKHMPTMAMWLQQHAEATRRIALENYPNLEGDDLMNVAIQENVLAQLENLRTHPAIAARISRGDLNLHGWVYKIEAGTVFSYDQNHGQFLPLSEMTHIDGRLYKHDLKVTI